MLQRRTGTQRHILLCSCRCLQACRLVLQLGLFTLCCGVAESLPEADYVIGFQNYGGLPSILQNALSPQDAPSTSQRIQVCSCLTCCMSSVLETGQYIFTASLAWPQCHIQFGTEVCLQVITQCIMIYNHYNHLNDCRNTGRQTWFDHDRLGSPQWHSGPKQTDTA